MPVAMFANMLRTMHERTRPDPVAAQLQYWHDRAMDAEHQYMLEFSRRSRANAMLSAALYQRDLLLKHVHAGQIRGPLSVKRLEEIDSLGLKSYHRAMRRFGFTERDADGNYYVHGKYKAHGTAGPLRLSIKAFMAKMEAFRKERTPLKAPGSVKRSDAA